MKIGWKTPISVMQRSHLIRTVISAWGRERRSIPSSVFQEFWQLAFPWFLLFILWAQYSALICLFVYSLKQINSFLEIFVRPFIRNWNNFLRLECALICFLSFYFLNKSQLVDCLWNSCFEFTYFKSVCTIQTRTEMLHAFRKLRYSCLQVNNALIASQI